MAKKNENLAQNITDKGVKYVHEDVLCYNTFHLFYQEKIGYWDFPVYGEAGVSFSCLSVDNHARRYRHTHTHTHAHTHTHTHKKKR